MSDDLIRSWDRSEGLWFSWDRSRRQEKTPSCRCHILQISIWWGNGEISPWMHHDTFLEILYTIDSEVDEILEVGECEDNFMLRDCKSRKVGKCKIINNPFQVGRDYLFDGGKFIRMQSNFFEKWAHIWESILFCILLNDCFFFWGKSKSKYSAFLWAIFTLWFDKIWEIFKKCGYVFILKFLVDICSLTNNKRKIFSERREWKWCNRIFVILSIYLDIVFHSVRLKYKVKNECNWEDWIWDNYGNSWIDFLASLLYVGLQSLLWIGMTRSFERSSCFHFTWLHFAWISPNPYTMRIFVRSE